MNWKSTFALIILAAAAGVWVWKGDDWGAKLGLKPAGAPADPPTLSALEADFTPANITRLEVIPTGGDPFVFERAGSGWKQPGNWPLRSAEVGELVETLTTLRTRFQPVPLPENADLATFGLAEAQKPLTVKVKTAGKEYTLRFGEPKVPPGEAVFTRPAFVRINDANEVLKLGPDVMPVLRRPADSYRRRQLFPDVERVKVAGGAPPFSLPGAPPESPAPATFTFPAETMSEIRVVARSPKLFGVSPWWAKREFTLKRTGPTPAPTVTTKGAEPTVQPDRLADSWAVESPVRDRVDPARLRPVLAAVPDLWVEEFIPAKDANFALDHPFHIALLMPLPLEPLPAALVRFHPDAAVLAPLKEHVSPAARARLDKPEQSITVTTKSGNPVTVKLGGIAKITEREENVTLPGLPGMPPRATTDKIRTVYRYAQMEGNPQLFTVAADKLRDFFTSAGDLVDSRVVPFNKDEVQAVTITTPGKPPIAISRKKGNPKATEPEEKRDSWHIEREKNPLLADSGRVDDLLDRLANFRASEDSDLYHADPKSRGLDPASCTTVTLVVREKRPEGEPDAPAREYKLLIGSPDFAAGKFPLQLTGWPRIALADDRVSGPVPDGWLGAKLFPERVSALFARPPIAYRARKLFDTPRIKLNAITVTAATNSFVLKQEKGPDGQVVWKLTTPIASDADPTQAADLIARLGMLQATEFVAEKGANPAEFGLDKPKLTATLTFDNNSSYKLEVGSARPGKPEVFARLDDGAVFALPTATTDSLATGALNLLPLQVWAVPLDKLAMVEVTRLDTPTESFTLVNEANNWKLTAPFAAAVPNKNAQPTLTALANLPAVKYEALSAPDPAKYGFDKPHAKVKIAYYTEKPGNADRPAGKTLVIGGVTPEGFDRYARLDEPNAPVFVLPGAYLFAVRTSPLALLDRNLLSLDPSKIAKVQIAGDKPESAVTLSKDEKGIWKADGATFTVDALVAAQLVSAFAPLETDRLAAYGDAVKWADYGLDTPEYTITVTLGGDKPETHKLQFGKLDPLGGRFARVDDGKAVAVVPGFAVRVLSRGKLEFADRTMLAFKPEELLGFSRTKGKEELELAPAAAVGWDVVKPAKSKADQPLVDELSDALGRLRAEKVVAFGKKDDMFKQHGLEPAEATITLTIGEKAEQKVLRIGKPVDAATPDGDRFAAVDSGAPEVAVGVLPAALANKLLASPVSFRDRTIVKFVDADKLVLERGERKVTFAKVNGTWKVTAPLAADAEQAALDDLVNELGKLRAADWVAEKPTPAELKTFGLENPEATWAVSNGDKVVLTLRIGKTAADGRVYATAGTGGMVALLGKPETAKVLSEYRVRKPWRLDAFQAESVEIARGGKSFILQKRGAAWVDPASPDDTISAPAIAELLGGLTALQVDRYAVDADGDPKLFGLEKPEATITVTFKDGSTRVLAVGGTVGGTDDKQRYAHVVDKGRTDVFVLSAADTARFTRDRATYVQKK